jgi:uncharacterized protein YeaO (DUF488 family)
MIRVKRAYDPPAREDGVRFLVERLWPRGMKKEALRLDAWLKEAAPSHALRKWFGHDPKRWVEFRRRYVAELRANAVALAPFRAAVRRPPRRVTLLYSARDTQHNSAVVLREFLERSAPVAKIPQR